MWISKNRPHRMVSLWTAQIERSVCDMDTPDIVREQPQSKISLARCTSCRQGGYGCLQLETLYGRALVSLAKYIISIPHYKDTCVLSSFSYGTFTFDNSSGTGVLERLGCWEDHGYAISKHTLRSYELHAQLASNREMSFSHVTWP